MAKKVRLEKKITKKEELIGFIRRNKIFIQLNIFYLLIVIFIVVFMSL